MTQVALVTWTESVGLTLVHRDLSSMHLKTPYGQILVFNILQIFPFTSETKRMGIILRVIITTLMTMDSLLFFLQLLLTLRLPPYLKFLTILFFPRLAKCQFSFSLLFLFIERFSITDTWYDFVDADGKIVNIVLFLASLGYLASLIFC